LKRELLASGYSKHESKRTDFFLLFFSPPVTRQAVGLFFFPIPPAPESIYQHQRSNLAGWRLCPAPQRFFFFSSTRRSVHVSLFHYPGHISISPAPLLDGPLAETTLRTTSPGVLTCIVQLFLEAPWRIPQIVSPPNTFGAVCPFSNNSVSKSPSCAPFLGSQCPNGPGNIRVFVVSRSLEDRERRRASQFPEFFPSFSFHSATAPVRGHCLQPGRRPDYLSRQHRTSPDFSGCP